MILFFDTETTGFYRDRLPLDHPDQPHIVQLAAQLCDLSGNPVAGFSFIVAGCGPIPEQASSVHGITDEAAARLGISLETALDLFTHLYTRADLVVAHNIKFDRGVIEVAIARHYKKVMPLRKPLFCTMEAATPIINMPPTERMLAAGFTKPKPPKLEECIKHFFGEDMVDAHDAMADLVACRRVYFHLQTLAAPATAPEAVA